MQPEFQLPEPLSQRRIVVAMSGGVDSSVVAALEGAFVLARAIRSKEPLLAAGETVLVAVEKALHDHA